MANEFWQVDGWPLNQTSNGVPIRDIEMREGLLGPPAPVGSNGTIANFTGELWRQKKHGSGKFVLNMWLIPNPATVPDVGAALDSAIDELYRAFQHTDRLLKFNRFMRSGEVRECHGEVITIGAAPIGKGLNGFRFAVEVNVPAAYWYSTTVYTQSTGASSTATRVLPLTNFAGHTAPLENTIITIAGGVTNPTVQDTTNSDLTASNSTVAPAGTKFQYYGTIPNDASLIVNSNNWTVLGSGGDSVGGFVPEIGRMSFTGGRFLTVAAPRPGRTSEVTFTGVNLSSTCNVTVSGRKFFQV